MCKSNKSSARGREPRARPPPWEHRGWLRAGAEEQQTALWLLSGVSGTKAQCRHTKFPPAGEVCALLTGANWWAVPWRGINLLQSDLWGPLCLFGSVSLVPGDKWSEQGELTRWKMGDPISPLESCTFKTIKLKFLAFGMSLGAEDWEMCRCFPREGSPGIFVALCWRDITLFFCQVPD